MIVLGADTHKRSHTIAAVSATSGALLGEQTVLSGAKGAAGLLAWARGLGEDAFGRSRTAGMSRASLERFLIERGERVLRVTRTLMVGLAAPRSRARQVRQHRRARGRPGGVARRPRQLPAAHLDGPELDLRLLVDHRERLVRQRVAINNTLQWHLHDLWPDLQLPGSSLFHGNGLRGSRAGSPALSRRCVSGSPATSCAAARAHPQHQGAEAEIADLVAQIAPHLLNEPASDR